MDVSGIQDIVVLTPLTFKRNEGMGQNSSRLDNMPISEFGSLDRFDRCPSDGSCPDEDALMEEILANINGTPLGQVLRRMASLPEIRRGKVLRLRQEITDGTYDEGELLEVALDRVLEDLTA